MGHTKESSHVRHKPMSADAEDHSDAGRGGSRYGKGNSKGHSKGKGKSEPKGKGKGKARGKGGRTYHNMGLAEQALRYLSWVVKVGYKELSLKLEEGDWIDVKSLTRALATSRPDFELNDPEALGRFLADEDTEGRFEISFGRLRKLARGERGGPGTVRPTSADDDKTGGGTRCPSSQSSRECSPARESDTEMMVEEEATGASDFSGADAVEGRKPAPPPGLDWQEYEDPDDNWWHYNGPLGEFWCTNRDKKNIQPYVA